MSRTHRHNQHPDGRRIPGSVISLGLTPSGQQRPHNSPGGFTERRKGTCAVATCRTPELWDRDPKACVLLGWDRCYSCDDAWKEGNPASGFQPEHSPTASGTDAWTGRPAPLFHLHSGLPSLWREFWKRWSPVSTHLISTNRMMSKVTNTHTHTPLNCYTDDNSSCCVWALTSSTKSSLLYQGTFPQRPITSTAAACSTSAPPFLCAPASGPCLWNSRGSYFVTSFSRKATTMLKQSPYKESAFRAPAKECQQHLYFSGHAQNDLHASGAEVA